MREIIIKGTIQLRLVDESVDLGNSEFSQWRPRGAADKPGQTLCVLFKTKFPLQMQE